MCRCLGLTLVGGASRHLGRLNDDEKTIQHVTHSQIVGGSTSSRTTLIAESGLYKLIMRSDKADARRFQDWVTREVLPAIRKDALAYLTPLGLLKRVQLLLGTGGGEIES